MSSFSIIFCLDMEQTWFEKKSYRHSMIGSLKESRRLLHFSRTFVIPCGTQRCTERFADDSDLSHFIMAQRIAFPRHVGLHYVLQSQEAYDRSKILHCKHTRFLQEIDEARAAFHQTSMSNESIRGRRLRCLVQRCVLRWLEKLYDPDSSTQYYLKCPGYDTLVVLNHSSSSKSGSSC